MLQRGLGGSRPRRRKISTLRCSPNGGGELPNGRRVLGPLNGGGEDPGETIQTCLQLFSQRSLDGLLDYISDPVLDKALSRVQAKARRDAAQRASGSQQVAPGDDAAAAPAGPAGEAPALEGDDDAGAVTLHFTDVLHNGMSSAFQLDAFALRLLVFHQPARTQVLSSMTLDESRFVQRCAVVGATGERSVLTFELVLEEALQPRYRGVMLSHRWFLRSVRGEPECPEPARAPDRALSPCLVVQSQLEALRLRDAATVFAFASPTNQVATGPLARFEVLLRTPAYTPLAGHCQSELLRSMQLNATTAMAVVGVTAEPDAPGAAPQRAVYVWVLSLQAGGPHDGCWLTDAVKPISSYIQQWGQGRWGL